MNETTYTVGPDDPHRLDAFVHAVAPRLSRRLARTLIRDGAVRLNGRRARKGNRLVTGDRVLVPMLEGLASEATLTVPVLHADDLLVAVDKPAPMPGHALDPRQRGTVAGFLVARYPEMREIGSWLAPGLVHRLDGGTSGVLVAARTPAAYDHLRAAFRRRAVRKTYHAVVAGTPAKDFRIEVALAHDPGDPRRMIAAREGLRSWRAVSEVTVERACGTRALVRIVMSTGVTHQIRAHLALAGHPVAGDVLYGGPGATLPAGRWALHASHVALPHPRDGRTLVVSSPIPDALTTLVE